MNWDDLAEIYAAALDEPDERRAAYLDAACEGRPELRAEIEALLAAESSTTSDWFAALGPDEVHFRSEEAAGNRIGERVGAFRLIRLLGRGGMGEVFLAEREDPEFGQQVAIKLLPATSRVAGGPGAESRFLQERRILASLRHPGIATLIDGGTTEDGQPFLALEYVDGEPLTEYCDRIGASLTERLRLFAVVCDVVQYAHSRLVVHRDLKPSNLLVTRDGAVKLLDFGIAKLLEPASSAGSAGDTDPTLPTLVLTEAQTRLFTPLRAAPEQLLGETITVATDIYALGLLLFELVSGRLPFRGSIRDRWEAERSVREGDLMTLREAAVAAVAAHGVPVPGDPTLEDLARLRATTPAALLRMLSGDLSHVVRKALERLPEKRYESARALGDELGRLLSHQPVSAHPPSWRYRATTFTRRHRLAVALTGAAALSLLSTAAVSWVQSGRLERERNSARAGEARAHAAMATLLQVLGEVDPATPSGDDRITVEELLARAEREARRAPVPEVAARLLIALGKLQHSRGRFLEAERCLAEAVRRTGATDPALLDEAEFARARALADLGRKREASELFERRALERRNSLGENHPSVLEAETEVANLLPPTEAAPRLRALLDRRRGSRSPGETAPTDLVAEATLLDYLGTAHGQMGNRSLAREAWREAFALLGAVGDGEDLRILVVLDKLSESENPAATEGLQRRRIEIATQRVGPDSTVTAISWNNLAVALALQGRYAEAEQAAREAWRIFELRLGRNHLETANTLRNIGRMQQFGGRYAEALATLREARRGFQGPEKMRGAVFVDAQVARVAWLVERDRRAISDLEAAAQSLAASSADPEDRYPADAFHHLGLSQLEAGEACVAVRTLEETRARRSQNGDGENGRGLETQCALALAREGCSGGAAGLSDSKADSQATSTTVCDAQPSWGLADPELVKRARNRRRSGTGAGTSTAGSD